MKTSDSGLGWKQGLTPFVVNHSVIISVDLWKQQAHEYKVKNIKKDSKGSLNFNFIQYEQQSLSTSGNFDSGYLQLRLNCVHNISFSFC